MSKLTQYIKRGIRYVLHGEPIIENKVVANIVTLAPSELLKGRTALITGGTSGIGKAIAEAFVNAGADVIITSRSQERADLTASEIVEKYQRGKVYGIAMDNTNISQMESVWKQICKIVQSPIDILVNNAGIGGGDISTTTADEYDVVMNTNLKAIFFLIRIVAKDMIALKVKGNILNIASSSSLRPANSAYILSKWGVRGLTEGMARALIPHNIVVNGLAPGSTATPMLNANTNNLYRSGNLIKRYITVEEIANMAVVLVSDMSRNIIGDIVYMTGGSGNVTNDDFNYDFHF